MMPAEKAGKQLLRHFPASFIILKKEDISLLQSPICLGKKKDDLMPSVPSGSGYYLLQLNYFLAMFAYLGSHILTSVFIIFISSFPVADTFYGRDGQQTASLGKEIWSETILECRMVRMHRK